MPTSVPESALTAAELPLTAFGPHKQGQLDLRVFDQTEWWIDARGTGHRITAMSPQYRRNVVGFLMKYAATYRAATLDRYWLEGLAAEAGLRSDLTGAERFAAHARLTRMTPEEWMYSTPLVRHLLSRLTRDTPLV